MVTKGQIVSIQDNTCLVRIPYFETVISNENIILEAQIIIQPGCYNCYSKDDMVWVAFEYNRADLPVVIGKIYAGAQEEASNFSGITQTASLKVSNMAELPADTQLGNTSIEELIKKVTALENTLSVIKSKFNL